MILAHYECETDKKQSLEEHSFNVANKAREEASLPSRGRGLKFLQSPILSSFYKVAPFTGAWIEMINYTSFI